MVPANDYGLGDDLTCIHVLELPSEFSVLKKRRMFEVQRKKWQKESEMNWDG